MDLINWGNSDRYTVAVQKVKKQKNNIDAQFALQIQFIIAYMMNLASKDANA